MTGSGSRGERGFSMIELMLAMALLIALLAGLRMTLVTGRKASTQASASIRLDREMQGILGRISEELRSASRAGEDTNGNGSLDGGEDTNGNGRLDSDWTVAAGSLTFNRLQADGTFSLPITFRLRDGALEYVKVIDASGAAVRTPLAGSVTDFVIAEDKALITVEIGLTADSGGEKPLERRQAINVRLRN